MNRERNRRIKFQPSPKPRKTDRGTYCWYHTEIAKWGGPIARRVRHTCISCKYVGEADTCPTCKKEELPRVGPIARPPRKKAGRGKWKEFEKHLGKCCAGNCR